MLKNKDTFSTVFIHGGEGEPTSYTVLHMKGLSDTSIFQRLSNIEHESPHTELKLY